MEETISFRYNTIRITSINEFKNLKINFDENKKDVCFIRLLGNYQELTRDMISMDNLLGKEMKEGKNIYKRITGLPKLVSMEEVEFYTNCYEKWIENKQEWIQTKALINNNHFLPTMLSRACKETIKLYRYGNISITSAMEKNYIVKLLYWFDFIVSDFIYQYKESVFVKIVANNIIKKQEYLFFYMLTLLGFHILLIQNEKDISENEDRLNLSQKYKIGNYSSCQLPVYSMEIQKENREEEKKVVISSMALKRRDEKKRNTKEQNRHNLIPKERIEKSFEELALLAASVVLIIVHNDHGEAIGSGSGIMIGRDGYILTNLHVLSHGRYYTIRIENDEQEYRTDEIIKYHSNLDLALIRIHHRLCPIPIYTGEKQLVRGQRVVAIGSPLGLFNSVSDGIISGFRMVDDIDMIQFTAPISRGSSGGAILNMYGEVIGISTAGFDEGQNINLAVGYESIYNFAKGFILAGEDSHFYK